MVAQNCPNCGRLAYMLKGVCEFCGANPRREGRGNLRNEGGNASPDLPPIMPDSPDFDDYLRLVQWLQRREQRIPDVWEMPEFFSTREVQEQIQRLQAALEEVRGVFSTFEELEARAMGGEYQAWMKKGHPMTLLDEAQWALDAAVKRLVGLIREWHIES